MRMFKLDESLTTIESAEEKRIKITDYTSFMTINFIKVMNRFETIIDFYTLKVYSMVSSPSPVSISSSSAFCNVESF